MVIISSITGMRPAPRTSYAVAKAAEIQLAATAAAELAADNVRVNAVSPGSILFPGGSWERFSQENPADFAAFLGTQFPFGRLGRLDEVADVVAFLLSRRASWITGANIVVNGGQGYPSARRFRPAAEPEGNEPGTGGGPGAGREPGAGGNGERAGSPQPAASPARPPAGPATSPGSVASPAPTASQEAAAGPPGLTRDIT